MDNKCLFFKNAAWHLVQRLYSGAPLTLDDPSKTLLSLFYKLSPFVPGPVWMKQITTRFCIQTLIRSQDVTASHVSTRAKPTFCHW